MADAEHIARLHAGRTSWNAWRWQNPEIVPDLKHAELALWEPKTTPEEPYEELNLSGAVLTDADLRSAKLSHANLSGANLERAELSGVFLNGANLSKATLNLANLSESHLEHGDFTHARLVECTLSGARLNYTNLTGANCRGAEFVDADLRNAVLVGVSFAEADLSLAELDEAALHRASLIRTNVVGADFRRARLGGTLFAHVDLGQVKHLTECIHHGPSTIAFDTLAMSGSLIPVTFLRGCGLSDWQIELAQLNDPTLSHAQITDIVYRIALLRYGGAIQFNSCFISHSSVDGRFVRALYTDLQEHGVRCWLAEHDLRIGDEWMREVDQSIHIHDKLLLVLSSNSLTSEYVAREVTLAVERERLSSKQILCPIRLDDSILKVDAEWAASVRTRHIIDFSRWNDEYYYARLLPKLLRELRAESARSITASHGPDDGEGLEEGDAVRIVDGPFAGFNGTIDYVDPETALLTVSFAVFGRPTRVDVQHFQLRRA